MTQSTPITAALASLSLPHHEELAYMRQRSALLDIAARTVETIRELDAKRADRIAELCATAEAEATEPSPGRLHARTAKPV